MLSARANTHQKRQKITHFFEGNNLELVKLPKKKITPLKNYLRLDYSNETFHNEAIKSTPRFTESRQKIYESNPILAVDNHVTKNACARTITTKQDRNPNSGIIGYDKITLVERNTHYRNLTPRECFLLMGFEEKSFDDLLLNNFDIRDNTPFLPQSKLVKLAGNSIVVPVLESIFKQVQELNAIV